MEFIAAWFYFRLVAYSRKLSGASQLDNYHRRIRASSFYCEKESLPLSSTSSLSFLFSLLGGFQPPLPPILSSNHDNSHCLLSESGVVAQKYRELVDSRRVASRITVTYLARINPRRLCNLSPSLYTSVSFFRTSALFSSLIRPVLSLLLDRSMSRMHLDVYNVTLLGSASGQSEHDERNVPRIWVR